MYMLKAYKISFIITASVPIARGQHLFPSRTQQLSLVAVTILGKSSPGKIARCRIMLTPSFTEGVFFVIGYFLERLSLIALAIIANWANSNFLCSPWLR
jgi:hypothetical protein